MGFLDNVSSSINRGMAGAGRTAETVKLRGQLNDINKQRQALAAQLGASLYEITKDDPAFRQGRDPLYQGIAQLDSQRDGVQAQLTQLEEQARASELAARYYTCPNCGGRVNETDLFCAGCGTPIDQVRAAAAPIVAGQAACPNCGAPMAPDDLFCMSCGTNVKEYAAAHPQADALGAGQPSGPVSDGASEPVAVGSADGGSKCPSCGQPFTPGDDIFCPNCGTKLG